jgi:hypothetical protein
MPVIQELSLIGQTSSKKPDCLRMRRTKEPFEQTGLVGL